MEENAPIQKEEPKEEITQQKNEILKENTNENIQGPPEEIPKNETNTKTENNKIHQINLQPPNSGNNTTLQEKAKRRRRTNSEIQEKNFKCPDCNKCYLSGPALTTHRKTKHNLVIQGEKRNRGRPNKKDNPNEINPNNIKEKFKYFFNDENRKPLSLDQTLNEKTITTDILKEYLGKIFVQCRKDVFPNLENVEDYSFYKLLVSNWEIENPFAEEDCYNALLKDDKEIAKMVKGYTIDKVFFFYLKEFSKKTNKDYFWFIIKFIILFRECMNNLRANLVKSEYQNENNKFYTQIFNAEMVPDICNDFFVSYMEPYQFFGLHKEELIELIQHFCYWLFVKRFTQSHLTLVDE